MAMVLTIESPKDLDAINDLLHDRWFSKDDIVFNHGDASLVIRFRGEASDKTSTTGRRSFPKRDKRPFVEWILKIRNVQTYSIVDTAEIGQYDFNELVYDESTRTVTITSGFPFQIIVAVKDLAITVEETAKVLAQNGKTSSS
jgi:hypothetical protein